MALVAAIVIMVIAANPRSVLFINGHVLTMDADFPVADALLVSGQTIVEVGQEADVRENLPKFTRVIDLQGQSVLPGFVDAHSHFPSAGLTQTGLDLTPPPAGNVSTLQHLQNRVLEAANSSSMGDWIIGFNYDDASLDIARHPTREELDEVAPENPVYLWHRSGHMGVANSLALEILGHEDTSTFIVNHSAHPGHSDHPDRTVSGRLTGLLQEGAAPPMSFLLRQVPPGRLFKALLAARDEYLVAGVTTAQNGFADFPSMRLLRWSQRLGLIPQRVVVWPAHDKLADRLVFEASPAGHASAGAALASALGWGGNTADFSISALKLVADGSPQGRTAWLSEPYLTAPAGIDGAEYRGHPAMPAADFKALVSSYHRAGFQLAMHGNGDAAIDLIIQAVAEAQAEFTRTDARHIVVHAQVVRAEQLEALAELDISVTFFPAHTYYWGDWYRSSILGEARARQISPLATADAKGIRYSLHSDAPVTPISPLDIMWSATTRTTLSGFELGPEYRISRERALRALTIDAAWQNHLDHDRGSLEPGKLADFIVLSGDPLIEPDVRDIRINQVWVGGKRRYPK